MFTEFLAHLDEYPKEDIYTDESKTGQHLGFTAVFQSHIYSGRLPDNTSIFTGKMDVVRTALTKIIIIIIIIMISILFAISASSFDEPKFTSAREKRKEKENSKQKHQKFTMHNLPEQ